MAALFALDCGGGSDSGDGGGASKGEFSVFEEKDTRKQAVKGGILPWYVKLDQPNLDPTTDGAGSTSAPALGAYSRLLREQDRPWGEAKVEYTGDLAESWEASPDGLQYTFKLRQDAKFDPRPPTSSRPVDADDVVFTWGRFSTLSPFRTTLSNAANPNSPIKSITKVDSRTVVMQLAYPWAPLFAALSNIKFHIIPREAESQFDPKTQTRGSGPWMLDQYQVGVSFQWRRNPNWFRKDVLYLDGYDEYVLPEYATQQSQFNAQRLALLLPNNAEDLLAEARAQRSLEIQASPYLNGLGRMIGFGQRPGTPLSDVRIRRAASMALDRDLFSEVDSGNKVLAGAGIPKDVFPDSHLSAAFGEFWLSPKDKSFGDGAKNFEHNVAEGLKLMSAAGFANGLEVKGFHDDRNTFSRTEQVAIWIGMLKEVGLRVIDTPVEYNQFLNGYWVAPLDKKGDFDGIIFGLHSSAQPHAAIQLFNTYHSKGGASAGRITFEGQSQLDTMIEAVLRQTDPQKQKSDIWEIQKQQAQLMINVPGEYAAPEYTLRWPWVKEGGSWISKYSPRYLFTWIDEKKKA
ncbi:MAG TPA: ABC transporter substrate-binding protein [Dehalococcoidia bacterium]|nr:ABC transporter substrate-binding protein [Dehalococcoidia bacterium]